MLSSIKYFGMGTLKFTAEKKAEIIEAFQSGKVAKSQSREVYGMHPSERYRWFSRYEAHGAAAFVKKHGSANYARELKIQCVEEYLRGKDNADAIVAKHNLSGRQVDWIAHYNANREPKDYDPKPEVYMADARRKTVPEERKEITEYCIAHGKDYKPNEKRSALFIFADPHHLVRIS